MRPDCQVLIYDNFASFSGRARHNAHPRRINCGYTRGRGGVFLKLRVTPTALLLLLLSARHDPLHTVALLAAVAWHEAGHLFAARRLGVRVTLLELDVFGAKIHTPALPSYRAEALLAGAGPLASLAMGCLFLPARLPFFSALSTLSFSFALLNLLPVSGFDGGRLFSAVFSTRFGPYRAAALGDLLSYLSLLFLFSLSACLLLRFGQDPALTVLCAALFARQFLKNRT